MARVKKQFIKLLSSLRPAELAKLQAQLVGPRVKALRREKAQLETRLKEIDEQLGGLGGPKPRKARRARKKARVHKVAPKPVVVKRRGRRKGTVADKIEAILAKAGKALRVKEICVTLVKAGMPKKAGLVNYVNRTLSANPRFKKAGWGVYTLAAAPAAAAPAKRGRKKRAAVKKTVGRKKGIRRKWGARRKKAATAKRLAAPALEPIVRA